MTPDTIRLDQAAKDQLVRLKRRTGIMTWNVLCRWALARSLTEHSPPTTPLGARTWALEIDWRTFAGTQGTAIRSALIARLKKTRTGVSEETVAQALDAHLHRGISYLAGTKGHSSIEGIMDAITESRLNLNQQSTS